MSVLLNPRMPKLSQVPPKSLRRVIPLTKPTVSARRVAPMSSISWLETMRTDCGTSRSGVLVRVAPLLVVGL